MTDIWLNNIFIYPLLLLIFEFLEIKWQKGNSVLLIILHNYAILKQKGIFVYILKHPSFIFICYLAIFINDEAIWLIFSIKILDIGYKIYLLDKIENNTLNVEEKTLIALSTNIGYIKYIGLVLYPFAFLISY